MWQISGQLIDPEFFQPLQLVEVLYDFDGPRTFTHRDRDGRLCLAHWCDADSNFNRFIVVPFTEALVQKLKAGEISLSEALDGPCMWVLDLNRTDTVHEAWSVKLMDIPGDVLPKPDTMLWLSLEILRPYLISASGTTPLVPTPSGAVKEQNS